MLRESVVFVYYFDVLILLCCRWEFSVILLLGMNVYKYMRKREKDRERCIVDVSNVPEEKKVGESWRDLEMKRFSISGKEKTNEYLQKLSINFCFWYYLTQTGRKSFKMRSFDFYVTSGTPLKITLCCILPMMGGTGKYIQTLFYYTPWFGWIWFYGISTIVGYLKPNLLYIHISNMIWFVKTFCW